VTLSVSYSTQSPSNLSWASHFLIAIVSHLVTEFYPDIDLSRYVVLVLVKMWHSNST